MKKSTMKKVALALLAGSLFQFGGCIGDLLRNVVVQIPTYLISEFTLDNNGVFDLFADN